VFEGLFVGCERWLVLLPLVVGAGRGRVLTLLFLVVGAGCRAVIDVAGWCKWFCV
jgi:hypothetical protein